MKEGCRKTKQLKRKMSRPQIISIQFLGSRVKSLKGLKTKFLLKYKYLLNIKKH